MRRGEPRRRVGFGGEKGAALKRSTGNPARGGRELDGWATWHLKLADEAEARGHTRTMGVSRVRVVDADLRARVGREGKRRRERERKEGKSGERIGEARRGWKGALGGPWGRYRYRVPATRGPLMVDTGVPETTLDTW